MNKKLKIIIFIQAFIVIFLLGILLGMKIQKDRMSEEGINIGYTDGKNTEDRKWISSA